MRKDLSRRTALDRTSSGDRILELRVAGVGSEVGMVRPPAGRPRLACCRREGSVAGRGGISGRDASQRLRRLKRQPRYGLGEFLSTKQGAARRASGNTTIREGARSKWTEAVFQSQSAKRQESPLVQIAPADLAY